MLGCTSGVDWTSGGLYVAWAEGVVLGWIGGVVMGWTGGVLLGWIAELVLGWTGGVVLGWTGGGLKLSLWTIVGTIIGCSTNGVIMTAGRVDVGC